MKEIKVEQSSEEWFDLKTAKVSASHANEMMMSKTTAGYKNYLSKIAFEIVTGQYVQSGYTNQYMEAGTANEPVARLMYELASGYEVRSDAVFVSEDEKKLISPDGIVGDDGLVEIKTQLPAIHVAVFTEEYIPKKYTDQMTMQLLISEREWCDFVSYSPLIEDNKYNFKIVRFEPSEQDKQAMLVKIDKFLAEADALAERIKLLGGK